MANRNALDGVIEPFRKAYDLITEIFFKVMEFPLKLWHLLPDWVHMASFITLFILSCLILWYIIATKNEFWEVEP